MMEKDTEIDLRIMQTTTKMFPEAGIMKKTTKGKEPLSMNDIQRLYEYTLSMLENQLRLGIHSGIRGMSPMDCGAAYNGRSPLPIIVIVEVQSHIIKYEAISCMSTPNTFKEMANEAAKYYGSVDPIGVIKEKPINTNDLILLL